MTASGDYVIDAKKYRGRPHLKIEGGLFRPRVERLLVGSRDCTKLVDGVLKQVGVVCGLLDDDVPVHGVLCFVEADWPLIGGTFTTRGVQALWPKKLYPKLQAEGPFTADTVAEIHQSSHTRYERPEIARARTRRNDAGCVALSVRGERITAWR